MARTPRQRKASASEANVTLFRQREAATDLARKAIEEEILLKNLPLVRKISMAYHKHLERTTCTPEDLVQEGFLGLHIAVQKFNPARNIAFATYAS